MLKTPIAYIIFNRPRHTRETFEEIRAARPSKEFDARFATENFAPNEFQNSTRWYEQMYNEAKTHLPAR